MSDYCDGNDIAYTRYADDITLSGNQRESIVEAIKQAENQLNHLGLNLNKEKTRIFGPASRQVVTGLVVNDWPQPSRKDRRKLRAILHQASLYPHAYADQLSALRGKAAYMSSFSSGERAIGALPTEYVRKAIDSISSYINKTSGITNG